MKPCGRGLGNINFACTRISDVAFTFSQFRWIKFEEKVEDGGERWSKPHVTTLSLHSLFELRTCIKRGAVLLDLEARNFKQILGMWEVCIDPCVFRETRPSLVKYERGCNSFSVIIANSGLLIGHCNIFCFQVNITVCSFCNSLPSGLHSVPYLHPPLCRRENFSNL